nr:ABC transporter permease [Lacticaseibacillus thailandensis]
MTGFGIRDSINAAGTRQFDDIIRYSAVVTLGDNGTPTTARRVLNKDAHYQRSTTVLSNTVKAQRAGHNVSSISLFVPTKTNNLHGYVNVETTKGDSIKLTARGVVLTQKAATILHAQRGSRVRLKLPNGAHARVRVTGIAQNYTGHFAYMTRAAYRAAFGHRARTNALLVRTSTQTTKQRRHLSERLLRDGGAINTSYADDQRTTIQQMSSSMDTFIVIIIVLSGLLSFVVLYNLTNINVSERMRELSTIKVLGFYDGEVTMYIVRENIILTIVGILVGFLLGNGLTAFILNQAASAQIIFPLVIHWPGYLLAAVLTAAFTAIVMWVTHRRLQRVDMVEALAARTD